MAGKPLLAAHMRRLVVVAGIVALVTLVVLCGSSRPGPAQATGNTIVNADVGPGSGYVVGFDNSIVLDASGFPVISYYAYHVPTSEGDLRVLHCGNAVCTAGNTIAIPDSAGDVGQHTSIALDGVGNPVVSYYDSTDDSALLLKILHCGDATCTAGNAVAGVDNAGNEASSTSLALDQFGNPVVSYYDGVNDDLKVLHCGEPTCSFGNTIAVPDAAGIVGGSSSLALDASGSPVVSYRDELNGALKLLHCGNSTCTAGNSIVSLGAGGLFTSTALDPSGYPVISHLSTIDFALKLVRCGNSNCTAGNSISTPAIGYFDSMTSLKLNAAGNPVVSYYESFLGILKILRCGNQTCTSGNTIATPDTNSSVGSSNSLALDTSGNPVVSYSYPQGGTLKVLTCGDATCKAPLPAVTPTSSTTPSPPPTSTPHPPPLGGVAAYPNAGSGVGAPLWAGLLATAIGLLALGGAARYARRRQPA